MAEREALKNWKSWSQSGDLFTPGAAASTSSGPVRCTADFRDEPGFYTVQFDINPPSVPIAATNQAGDPKPIAIDNLVTVPVLVTAEIIWKNRGNNVRRKISVSQGSTISGFGEGCDVTMNDATPPVGGGDTGFGVPVKYAGTISIANGVRATTEQPPILQAFSGIQPLATDGTEFVIPIPRNCGIISFRAYMVSEDFTTAVQVAISAENGYHIIRRYDDIACNDGFVPLPPNATQLVFVNCNADHICDLSLDWGIDG